MNTQALIDKKRDFAATYFRDGAASRPRVQAMRGRTMRSPSPRDLELGRRVREVRLARGVTQEQLAAELQLTFQQVQKYENGSNRIGATRLVEICTALVVPLQSLLSEDCTVAPIPQTILTPAERALVASYRLIRSDQRRSVNQIVNALAQTRGAGE